MRIACLNAMPVNAPANSRGRCDPRPEISDHCALLLTIAAKAGVKRSHRADTAAKPVTHSTKSANSNRDA